MRWNGRAFETFVARHQHREPGDLYHSALEVQVDHDRFVIEMTPSWASTETDRGVACHGAVGLSRAGRSRFSTYEVRCWRNGIIPDVTEASFLVDGGFVATAESLPDVIRRPATVVVRFMSADTTVETALSFGFTGEDAIHTTVLTTEGSSEFGPSVAHKGHEAEKALRAQAAQVQDLLAGR